MSKVATVKVIQIILDLKLIRFEHQRKNLQKQNRLIWNQTHRTEVLNHVLALFIPIPNFIAKIISPQDT